MNRIISQTASMACRRRLWQAGAAFFLTLCLLPVHGQAVADESAVIPETLSAGGYHSCGIRVDGTVACWGRNDSDQASPPGDTFIQISAGDWHTCGVRTDGTLDCWGSNFV